MTEISARFDLPLLQAGQAQKEIFHNEALVRVDAILHPAVATIASEIVPSAPQYGSSWIVGADASGDWAGHAGQLATWTMGGWRFVEPIAGMTAWLLDKGTWVWHDGQDWQDAALPVNGVAVDGKRVVGAQQPAIGFPSGGNTMDAEARAALAAIIATLRVHGLIAT